jgi:hypothetical protein
VGNPQRADAILAWYSVAYESDTRDSLVLTVVELDGPAAAGAHLDQTETGQAFAPMDPPIGDRSALAPAHAEAGIGAALVLVKGRILLSLHATGPIGGMPIADADQIMRLARSAASRVY